MVRTAKGTWRIVVLVGLVPVLASLAIATRPEGRFLNWVVRWSAMVGYVAAFLGIVSSGYMRQLYRLLGRPFLWAHHALSIGSLALLVVHPAALAVATGNVAVFVPKFDSWLVFLELGGRPALYLMATAAVAAVVRKSWRKGWRLVHQLNYIAFLLGTVHAVLIGTDLGRPSLRLIPIAMAVAAIGVYILKRVAQARR